MNIFTKLLSKMFGFVINLVKGLLSFPIMPPEILQSLEFVMNAISKGIGIVNFFLPINAIAPGITFVLLFMAVVKGYYLVMFILRKIPFLGIG